MTVHYKGSFTPEAASLTGHASNVTGATWTIATTTAGDGLAHLVTIRNDAATDHTGKTAALTGTDANGDTLTETVTLPDVSATVTSTKHFKTLTTIVPSASIGGDTMDIGWSAVSVTPTYKMDANQPQTNISLAADISGTINYGCQVTFDNLYQTSPPTPVFLAHATFAGKTADFYDSFTNCVYGVRFIVNSVTAGATMAVYVCQGIS